VLSQPLRLEEGACYRIGRDKATDIPLPSTHVSRLHAEITWEKGHWVIGDLGSRNGTFVNGERVFKRALREGDKIAIGHFEIVYRELSKTELETARGRKGTNAAETLKLSRDAIGFFGDVKKLSVVEVVQLLSQNRKTGTLTIYEEKGTPECRLDFVEGAIVHAEFGLLAGEGAVQPVLRTRAGKFAFVPKKEQPAKMTIQTPTATLLLKAALEAKPAQP
jgi:pSer/pThr/pTyr-binding forkhead associated (FHA) protein